MNEEREEERRPVSLWWTFVPIFLGALGGVVAWKLTKHRHNEMAMILLVLGIAFTVVIIPFYIWILTLYFS
jgi:CHASE2 domain-containing sensor protein